MGAHSALTVAVVVRGGRRLRQQHDLAARVSVADELERLGRLRQRIGAGDDDLQRAVRGGRQQPLPGVRPDVRLRVVAADQRDAAVGPPERRDRHDPAVVGDELQGHVDGLVRADRVDRRVHSVRCDRPDPVGQPGPVRHRDRPVAAQQLVVGLAGGTDHPDALPHGELDRDLADTARGTVHQQRLAGLDRHHLQRVRCRAADREDGPRDRPVESRRLRHDPFRGGDDVLGVPTVDRVRHDLVADGDRPAGPGGVRTDGGHHPRDLEPHRQRQAVRIRPHHPRHDLVVHRVDARGLDRDHHLAGPRLRDLDLDRGQDLRATERGGHDLGCHDPRNLGGRREISPARRLIARRRRTSRGSTC